MYMAAGLRPPQSKYVQVYVYYYKELRKALKMNENKMRFMREVINLLPMTGTNITQYSLEMGFNKTKLYNFRRGLFPSEEQYNHFLDFLIKNHRYEMAKIMAVLNVSDKDVFELEENIERYFKKLESKNKVGRP